MDLDLREALECADLNLVRKILANVPTDAIFRQDFQGNSALHLAATCAGAEESFFEELLIRNVDPSVRNEAGQLAQDLPVSGSVCKAALESYVEQLMRGGESNKLEEWVRRGWTPPDKNSLIFQKFEKNITEEKQLFEQLLHLQSLKERIASSHKRFLNEDFYNSPLSAADELDWICLDATGMSAIHKAVVLELTGVLQYIIDREDSQKFIGVFDHMQRTPLHYAAVLKSTTIFTMLSKSIDLKITQHKDLKGFTPMQYQDAPHEIDLQMLHNLIKETDSSTLNNGNDSFCLPTRPANTIEPEFQTKDAYFMYRSVGDALVLALTEIVQQQPPDPIEYLGLWLRKHSKDIRRANEEDADRRQLEQARRDYYIEERRRAALQREQEHVRRIQEEQRRAELEGKRALLVSSDTYKLDRIAQRDAAGRTQLHRAAVSGKDAETILNLMLAGENLALRDASGCTARQLAMESKNQAVVEELDAALLRLMENAAMESLKLIMHWCYSDQFPNVRDVYGPDAFGLPDITLEFLDDVASYKTQQQLIWTIVRNASQATLQRILKTAMETEKSHLLMARDVQGRCALHLAVQACNEEAVVELVKCFPSALQLEDNLNRVPLHYAYAMGSNLVNILVEAGANTKMKDTKNNLPNYYSNHANELPELIPLNPQELDDLRAEEEKTTRRMTVIPEPEVEEHVNDDVEKKLHIIKEEPEP